MNLDHIALIVSSEDNLLFYKQLGFNEFKRIERDYDVIVFMKKAGIVLEIFVDGTHPDRLMKPEAKGVRYIGFTVEDFEVIVDRFNCEKINTDWFGRRYVLINDMDGQSIEIIESESVL